VEKKLAQRFLSPDNYVQQPDNTQNFNRYSYCLNNPLLYTDPTGNKFNFWDVVLGSVFGAASWQSIMGYESGKYNVGQAIGMYFVNAAAFIAGAGVGNAATLATGFSGGVIGGAIAGGAGGFAGGTVSGMGSSLMMGNNIFDAYRTGLKQGIIGGTYGAVIGGLVGGLSTLKTYKDPKVGDGLELKGAEMTEKEVESAFKQQNGYGEGEYNIEDITTSAPSGAKVGDDGIFAEGNDQYYGLTKQRFWTGKIDVYISPYATRDIVFANGVMTHEFQHVVQFNMGVVKYLTTDQLEKDANLHEIKYLLSLPINMYKDHNILRMIQICHLRIF
jgi:hypothetical protein